MAKAVPDATILGNEMIEITGLEYHSQMIKPGNLFVAITGFKTDGNRYIDDAVKRGAVAVATEKDASAGVPILQISDARAALADLAAVFYGYTPTSIKICAVTGTNGKTTSCFLLRNMLEARGKRVGLITSLLYDTGTQQINASRTTPESLDIHRLLYAMQKNYCVNAVIETSSHALILHRVRNLNVQVALFTNLTRDHLDFHKDMDDYLAAKAKLLDMVDEPSKWAVINLDSPEFCKLLGRAKCSYLTYSVENKDADVYLEKYSLEPSGSVLMLHAPTATRPVRLKLPGRFNLYNALGATAAALASGVDIDSAVAGLEKSEVIPGRLERVASDAPFSVFVDYAHTPDALQRTIETLRELSSGRVLTLFGCGGDRDRGKRPLMAETVTKLADYSVLTSDNPRSEDPTQIFDDTKKGISNGAAIDIIEDRREAIYRMLEQAHDGDVVLLAGKGAENYQEIDGVRHPFLDRDVATEALQKLGYGIN